MDILKQTPTGISICTECERLFYTYSLRESDSEKPREIICGQCLRRIQREMYEADSDDSGSGYDMCG